MSKINKPKVIVIGAGACGLMAAAEISAKCNITIIEARDHIGGRIRTAETRGGIVEAGAEFVHGDTPITNRLINEGGLELVKLDGKMMRKEAKAWTEEENMIEGWDELVEKMKGQRKDMTMDEFMMKHFGDQKYTQLRRHIKAFAQGFDVADVSEVSVQSLYREWSNESDQFRIKTGYGSLIKLLEQKCRANECEIFTKETVRQIDWEKNDVTVYTAAGNKYYANKVLVTVPVSVLRGVEASTTINITPPVDEYINAARQIGYGTVIKLVFEFSEKLWRDRTGFIFSNEMIPTWWTQYPVSNNILTGWVGGPPATRLSQHSDNELLEIAIHSLASIFERDTGDMRSLVTQSHVFNWNAYEEALGAYSYSKPESAEARELLNTPLEDSLFFAGEGLYDGKYSGTVEAALTSGADVARKILKAIS
jgi:monoamine oxidase